MMDVSIAIALPTDRATTTIARGQAHAWIIVDINRDSYEDMG